MERLQYDALLLIREMSTLPLYKQRREAAETKAVNSEELLEAMKGRFASATDGLLRNLREFGFIKITQSGTDTVGVRYRGATYITDAGNLAIAEHEAHLREEQEKRERQLKEEIEKEERNLKQQFEVGKRIAIVSAILAAFCTKGLDVLLEHIPRWIEAFIGFWLYSPH